MLIIIFATETEITTKNHINNTIKHMSRQFFDNLDLTILHALTSNARTPYLEIAREYGVSGAAVHQRVQRLLANKVITGSECLVDPETVGLNVIAYLGICLQPDTDVDSLVEALQTIPEVTECHVVGGRYDMMVKLYARDNKHLYDLIKNRVRTLPVTSTETMMSFSQVLRRPIPISNE